VLIIVGEARLSELTPFKKRAYLLVEVEPGREAEFIRRLEEMDKIVNTDFVHGEYDIVAVLEGDWREIDQTIIAVRKLPGLRKTVTLTVFDLPLKALE